MAKDEDLDELMSHLGEFGKYQWIQFLLHILAAFTAGMHMLSLVTVAPVPPHQCAPVSLSPTQNFTPAANEDGSISSCYLQDWSTNETMECQSWIYDTTYYKSSRAMEWNMVCDRRWMGAIGQSSYMFGVFTGAVVLGTLADRYGRKTIFYISGILQLILGVGITFVNEYYTFLIISFFYGSFGSAGAYITGFVLSMELVGSSKRTACGVTFQATFATGIMMVALWAFVIHDRFYLQLIYGLHSLLLIGHWWLIDESPRWLWAQGRIKESVDIVAKGVKINGGRAIDTAYYVSRGKATESRGNEATKAASIADMFKTPNLRLKTLNVSLNWFANSLAYYGLSLNVGSMFGNPHFMLFIMGLIEIPSYVLTVLFLDKTGRRCLTSSLMVIGGSACLLTAFLPEGEGWKTFGTSIVFLGKFCIAGSFAIIYNYSAELFPTVLRNTALGFGSMCARFSATLTPLITLLDSFDKRVPTVVFATVALVSGALTTLLPETLNQPMPQSIEDGEKFGEGDTCFTTGCFGTKKRSPTQ